MSRGLVLLMSSLWLAACGAPAPPPAAPTATVAPVRAIPCDDGGSGGVMIDGVCL